MQFKLNLNLPKKQEEIIEKKESPLRLVTSERFINGEDSVSQNILLKLKGLGITGIKIKSPIVGPIVSVYPIEINASTPISKILNKSEDIALACNVDSVDIRRIGNEIHIFIPNQERKIVDFKESLQEFLNDENVEKMKLPILLGTDTIGNQAVIDLTEQPHILVAGSTGSGKSIFESNLICSLSMFHDSNKLQFFLVDTKGLDLSLFEKMNHVRQTAHTLEEWYELIDILHGEVAARNTLMRSAGVRNISEYNNLGNSLPFIVLVIDELGDLIQKDKDERKGIRNYPQLTIDADLRKLVQVSRAAGIHVIACTQRVSVDIISGSVKANFPTRISFKLPTGIDSRTILDGNGAENLLGRGDMLVKFNDSEMLKRFHSPFVRIEDIKAIIEQRDLVLSSMRRMKLNG